MADTRAVEIDGARAFVRLPQVEDPEGIARDGGIVSFMAGVGDLAVRVQGASGANGAESLRPMPPSLPDPSGSDLRAGDRLHNLIWRSSRGEARSRQMIRRWTR